MLPTLPGLNAVTEQPMERAEVPGAVVAGSSTGVTLSNHLLPPLDVVGGGSHARHIPPVVGLAGRGIADRTRSRETAAIVFLVLFALMAFAWPRPLMLPDEGRYAGVAWEMLRSGDWLTPTLDGLPYFHKPPLFYWLTALSFSVFGPTSWAARAAPLIGAWVGAAGVFLFLRRWRGDRIARLALVALLTQPAFYLAAQFANLDMLVAGLITCTVFLLAHAALCFERALPFRRWLAAAAVAGALGVLAKGLIGAVIPVLVVGSWLLVGQRWRTLRALLWPPAVLLFLAVAAPWFAAMQFRFAEFFDYFFVIQHFQRFAEGGFNNVQPFWFFPAVLVALALPWLPWLRVQFVRGDASAPDPAAIRQLMGIWIIVVVLFFSIPQSKLLGYILPAIPPLAMLAADGFARHAYPAARALRWWRGGAAAMAAMSFAVVAVLSLHPFGTTRELGQVLREQRTAAQPVYMIGDYYFDIPVYARLTDPVRVVDDWASPRIQQRDNWRRELVDAARLASPDAAAMLVPTGRLADALCTSQVSWVIGASSASERFQVLANAEPAATRRGITLWRVDAAKASIADALRCPRSPYRAGSGQPRTRTSRSGAIAPDS